MLIIGANKNKLYNKDFVRAENDICKWRKSWDSFEFNNDKEA